MLKSSPHRLLAKYKRITKLIWSSVDSSFKKKLQWNYRNLSSITYIKRIQNPSHPCNNELGLFAKNKIKKGHYIGEYTGKVSSGLS